MKKQFALFIIVLVCALFLSGCSNKNAAIYNDDYKSVEPVGEIPDEFKKVIENNIFNGAYAFNGRLLKAETTPLDKENHTVIHNVKMMDAYGNKLAEYSCSSDDLYYTTLLAATDDGGFLFALGFEDRVNENMWASDNGFASRVIKCDKNGNLQFDTPFNGLTTEAFKFCFEKNGQFYIFGNIETPDTKVKGVHSPTDIYMVILDKNGKVLKNKCIAGSDYDSLKMVELFNDYFVLSCSSQSDDGDFAGSNSKGYPIDWSITVNFNLDIAGKKKESGRDYIDYKIGEKDGVSVHKSDSFLKDFDAGNPEALIDYGDFYLIVSTNITGIREDTPPIISSVLYYTETVYSAYDNNNKLIFRASAE